ncbi:Zinc finger protein ZAT9 [Apostasia shenzhenica]|uniref:Zinc finger protein ZAT9 n=1 Tax=Apostasia shenzhenica TaxID=1088818 RepID=A0A2I0A449_9ASPA|nr:Zinc finger protein ZAT9 [Apostasia shenzhenica]
METHCCKFCSRGFPSGRSLGGHMRSHVAMNSPLDSDGKPATTYGLRENPKKKWRLSDNPSPEKDNVKLCRKPCADLDEDFSSDGVDEERDESEKQIDSEVTAIQVPRRRRQRRRSRRVEAISASDFLPFSSSEFEKEQEDGALCLMMLSRAAGSVTDSSDLNSVILEKEEDFLRSGYRLIGLKKADSGFSLDEADNDEIDPADQKITSRDFGSNKRSRYLCTICNKSFHSYQALGGHRASHKKNRAADLSSESPAAVKELNNQTARRLQAPESCSAHECTICGKVFASGQALGGHKRSHVISCAIAAAAEIGKKAPKIIHLLDLNLPADEGGRDNPDGIVE